MPTAAFTTLGCKVNQYETQKILESFVEAGFDAVPFEGPADVYVINTCSVTSQAEAKSRYTIRKARRANPEAKVVVTGCAGQMAINKGEEIDGADLVVPNPEKLNTLRYFLDVNPPEHLTPDTQHSARFSPRTPHREEAPEHPTPNTHHPVTFCRTRATLKIQDGCSVHCAYCSIPYTRPVMSSRPCQEVLDEAKDLVGKGYREIVLTGVLIGAYGPETGSVGPDFEDLVEMLAVRLGAMSGGSRIANRQSSIANPQSPRLRISSIEMTQVTDRLTSLIQRGMVVPHLHIPLQAGNSQVLADMGRPYTQADYFALCEKLYKNIPDISITTDIMVGFPTETIERFESTLEVCDRVNFLKAHVFRFSPRYGTPADRWGDPIRDDEKQRRAKLLGEITRRTGQRHVRRFLGRTMRVLVEGKIGKDGLLEGLTDNYITVKFAGPPSLQRQYASVSLDEEHGGVAFGTLKHLDP